MKRSNADTVLLNKLIQEQREELKKESETVYYSNRRGYTGKGTMLSKKWYIGIKA